MTDKAKILIVDDDIDFVESTRTILESKPYEVIIAQEGEEALRKAREEKPGKASCPGEPAGCSREMPEKGRLTKPAIKPQ